MRKDTDTSSRVSRSETRRTNMLGIYIYIYIYIYTHTHTHIHISLRGFHVPEMIDDCVTVRFLRYVDRRVRSIRPAKRKVVQHLARATELAHISPVTRNDIAPFASLPVRQSRRRGVIFEL